VVSLKVNPLVEDEVKLRKYLNLHYLGDVDANELVDGVFKAKYPEKETEEYKNATDRVWRGYNVNLSVVIDDNGIPTTLINDSSVLPASSDSTYIKKIPTKGVTYLFKRVR
jgi:hypothetical protein